MCTCTKMGGGGVPSTFAIFYRLPGDIMLGQLRDFGGEAVGRNLSLTFAMFFGLLLGLCFSAAAQDAKSVLQSANKAMGDVKSIQFSGSGEFGGGGGDSGGGW